MFLILLKQGKQMETPTETKWAKNDLAFEILVKETEHWRCIGLSSGI